jgi:UDP-glucose 4-epimerase
VFNVTPEGVLPLGTAIRLAGRAPFPIPRSLASPLVGALWIAQIAEAPPSFFDYLQYVCVADGSLASRVLGFQPLYTSREAIIDFANAQHLRDVKLLSETPA